MSVRWSLSYGEAEYILAQLHGASGDIQKNAFRGRLKHLKRLGIPLNNNPGRGSKIDYFEDDLYQWAFCLELAEFGIDPKSIAAFVAEYWESDILPKFHGARASRGPLDDLCFVANPRMMAATWDASKGPLPFKWIKARDSQRLVQRLTGNMKRAILINISDLLRGIAVFGTAFSSREA